MCNTGFSGASCNTCASYYYTYPSYVRREHFAELRECLCVCTCVWQVLDILRPQHLSVWIVLVDGCVRVPERRLCCGEHGWCACSAGRCRELRLCDWVGGGDVFRVRGGLLRAVVHIL